MTMGPPQAEEALRECLALGAAAGDPPLGSRVRGRGHARDLAHARAGDREGRRRSRPLRTQGARLGDVAGAVSGGRVPRLAARHERRGGRALRRHAPPHARDGLRRGGVRGRRCRSSSPSAFRPEPATNGDRNGPIEVWQATDLVDDLQPNDKRFGQTGSPTRVLAVRDARPERAGIRAASARGGGREGSRRCSPSARPSRRAGRSPTTSPRSRARGTTAGASASSSTAGCGASRSS